MTEIILPEGEGWGTADNSDEPARPLEQVLPAERWRRWTPPAAIEDSPTDVIVEDGEMSRAVDVTWPAEVIEKIRQGYQCLKCAEPQPAPFPDHCGNPVCRYPMRAQQADDFEKEFHGSKWVGPKVSLEEELAMLEERSARRTHNPGSSISVPSRVSKGGVLLPPGVSVAP